MKIVVTKEDIAKGTAGSGMYCPISRACKRLFSNNPNKYIYTYGKGIIIGGTLFKPKTKKDVEKLNRFVSNFDSARRRFCRPTTINVGIE